MKEHRVVVYTTKDEIERLVDNEGVSKAIEINDKTLILYYANGLIEVWHDDVIEKYHDDIESFMDDAIEDDIVRHEYRYRYEFALEKYLL